MRRALALGLALAFTSAPAPSRAAGTQRLTVFELASPPNLSGIAIKLTQEIILTASRDPNYTIIPATAVEMEVGTATWRNLLGCAGKLECVLLHASKVPADRIIAGLLDRTENSYVVKLFLIDLKAKAVVAKIDRSVLIASRRLHADVTAAVPDMLQGEAEAEGRLEISATIKNATVTFDGELVGKTPITLQVKPGKHLVKLTKEKYLPVERYVTVAAGSDEKVELLMTPVPGAKPEELVDRGEAPEDAGAKLHIPAAAWVCGGAAVAALGAGTWFGLQARDIESRAGEQPPYAITRVEAQKGARSALAANALFAAAGAGLVTGVLITVFSDPPPAEPKLDLPQATFTPLPGGAAVGIAGTF